MTKTTLQILKDARELISDPENWIKDYYARDASGKIVSPRHGRATCWCSEGALLKVIEDMDGDTDAFNEASHLLNEATGDDNGFVAFNDTHSHAEILAMFDRAISSEERRAAE